LTTSEPMNPVAPVTNMRMGSLHVFGGDKFRLLSYCSKVVSLFQYNG
jgi:hypothetical protein